MYEQAKEDVLDEPIFQGQAVVNCTNEETPFMKNIELKYFAGAVGTPCYLILRIR